MPKRLVSVNLCEEISNFLRQKIRRWNLFPQKISNNHHFSRKNCQNDNLWAIRPLEKNFFYLIPFQNVFWKRKKAPFERKNIPKGSVWVNFCQEISNFLRQKSADEIVSHQDFEKLTFFEKNCKRELYEQFFRFRKSHWSNPFQKTFERTKLHFLRKKLLKELLTCEILSRKFRISATKVHKTKSLPAKISETDVFCESTAKREFYEWFFRLRKSTDLTLSQNVYWKKNGFGENTAKREFYE